MQIKPSRSSILVFIKSVREWQVSHVLIGFRYSEYPRLIHLFPLEIAVLQTSHHVSNFPWSLLRFLNFPTLLWS